MKLSRIIVTGASGMIGSHIIDIAAAEGIEAYAVVRRGSKKISNIATNKNVRIIECDLCDIGGLGRMIDGPSDAFFHLAWDGVFGEARNDAYAQERNVRYTLDAIRAAAETGARKFVLAGSQAEYGLQNATLGCDTVPQPITSYGIAKNAAFQLGKILADSLGVEINSGRILSAYGARDNDYTMVSSTLIKLMRGEVCSLSECTQTWDYIYAEDVAAAMLAIAESGVNGKAYPIGSGKARPLKDFVEIMREKTGADESLLKYGSIELKDNAVRHLACDVSELTRDTGFKPRYSFPEGIEKTIAWLQSRKNNQR